MGVALCTPAHAVGGVAEEDIECRAVLYVVTFASTSARVEEVRVRGRPVWEGSIAG